MAASTAFSGLGRLLLRLIVVVVAGRLFRMGSDDQLTARGPELQQPSQRRALPL